MKAIATTFRPGISIACFFFSLLSGALSAQILRVDSVMVDSVWNSDSLLYDGNGILQQRIQRRDCRLCFTPRGEGTARMFIAMSLDSAQSWTPSPNPLTVLDNALASPFVAGRKASIIVRVLGGDRPGVSFLLTARQSAPMVAGNPKSNPLGLTSPLIPGQDVAVTLGLRLSGMASINGYCSIAKVYWDTLGDGTPDDSTIDSNALSWTWRTRVPPALGQKRGIVARAKDKNGLSSMPETLLVQFGLQRIIVMKDIPAGKFTMGSANALDLSAAPPHQVSLSAFKMQETEVTQEQYLAIMGTNPAPAPGDPGKPAQSICWYDAVGYCNALSLALGLAPVYDTSTWSADFAKTGYRLPTEAQWEYACRAGSTTAYWWGADTVGMGARAWTSYNSPNVTHLVATKLANAYGLYDMIGNVWEWCSDWFGNYSAAAAIDPPGPSLGELRILRGGSPSELNTAEVYRSAFRVGDYPATVNQLVGFRVALPK